MRVLLICPAPPGSRLGNRVTALRWKRILTSLGHQARIASELTNQPYDLLVPLHARRSAAAVFRSRALHPEKPIALALTGTDLYRDIHTDPEAKKALALADRFIVLHERAALALPKPLRGRAVVVHQSAGAVRRKPRPRARTFEVAFVAHLRPEKDPLRAALAVRLLPPLSKIRILHAGRALTADLANLAKAEENRNPRYEWLGEVSGRRARSIIARSRLLVLTSRMEGGANVVSEALAARTPVIASRIACTEALLGENYPGFFPVGSTKALARLLGKFEADAAFQRELSLACARQAWKVAPPEERRAWRRVVAWARG